MDEPRTGRQRTSIHVGGFSHTNPVPAACRLGPFVFSGAITGRDPDTRLMPADLDTQCVNMFRHVREIVAAAGASTGDIVKMTVWLRDFRDRAALNREWQAMFPDPDDRPARHALAAEFDGDMLVQCDFVAVPSSAGAVENELVALVKRERFARDTGDWAALEDAYWPDSLVRVTWFEGNAAEFVAVSRERKAKGGGGMHQIDPVRVTVRGERALIESRGQILIRPRVHDIECDVTSWCRFFSRAERRQGQWRLVTFDAIYGKDRLDPVLPGTSIQLDADTLGQARRSYRYLTYLNRQGRYPVSDDLPGDDRPDLVEAFYAEAQEWLSGSG
jgi:2-iminobutanoate/2-iminopropanoate deaminase